VADRGRRSPWLARARITDGMLAIPGRPHWRADLLLGREGAVVVARDGHRVPLGWDEVWSVGAGPEQGQVSVGLPAARAEGLPVVREARVHPDQPRRVPLRGGSFRMTLVQAEGDTVGALVDVLRDRAEVRERLWDLERVAALVADLRRGVRFTPFRREGARRTTFEILAALRRLGYEHRYGRPVPGDAVAGHDDVVAAVRRAIEANPHCDGLDISDDAISGEVERAYSGIAPWPFAALTT
jgi:hypothetical protein